MLSTIYRRIQRYNLFEIDHSLAFAVLFFDYIMFFAVLPHLLPKKGRKSYFFALVRVRLSVLCTIPPTLKAFSCFPARRHNRTGCRHCPTPDGMAQ